MTAGQSKNALLLMRKKEFSGKTDSSICEENVEDYGVYIE